MLFAGFAFVVLLGTVFPLIVEAIDDRRVSVGVPYFNRMAVPIGLALLFLMAVAPVLPWRKASTETLSQRLLWPAWFGVGVVVACVAAGARGIVPLVAFGLGAFAGGAALRQVILATRRNGWRGLVGRTNGGMIVHLGVVMIAVGLAASGSFAEQAEARMAPGETRTVHGHQVTYVGYEERDSDPSRLIQATEVRVDGKTLEPRLQRFPNATQEIGKPAVRYGIGDTSTWPSSRRPARRTARSSCASSSSPWWAGCGPAAPSWSWARSCPPSRAGAGGAPNPPRPPAGGTASTTTTTPTRSSTVTPGPTPTRTPTTSASRW